MGLVPFVCPETREPLTPAAEGLRRSDGRLYPYLPGGDAPDFSGIGAAGPGRTVSLQEYNTAATAEVYDNFLTWMFATFVTEEVEFRRSMAEKLSPRRGGSLLVTGCGLGHDLPALLDAVGPDGSVHAQDLSPAMVLAAQARLRKTAPEDADRVSFSVGDAGRLPFADSTFDAAFHFGGINLFDDLPGGIREMDRVVRKGGRVLVSDEGVAPWLRGTDYAQMVITNNRLWAYEAPIGQLPATAQDVRLTWVLGGCFWVIDFTVSNSLPNIDPHIVHKGRRGGSMWTRHHGQLEPVTPETKAKVIHAAATAGLSVHDWMEQALQRSLKG